MAEGEVDLDQVHYCYRCGRNVGRAAQKCWYCGAPTRRVIRPPRRCPYCDEPIRPKAVKCFNCGEFLDDRERRDEPKSAKEKGATYIIDKAVFHGGELPDARRRERLDAPEQGKLEADDRGARRLDAPGARAGREDEDSIRDVSFEEIESASGENLPMRRPEPPARREPPEEKREGRELARASRAGELAPRAEPREHLLPALWNAARGGLTALRETRREKHERIEEAELAEEDDPYRTCGICGTEIFKVDNYCYHCGQKYGEGTFSFGEPVRPKNNVALFALIAVFMAAHFAAARMAGDGAAGGAVSAVRWISGAGAPLLCLWAFRRRKTFFNQFAALVLFGLSLIGIVVANFVL